MTTRPIVAVVPFGARGASPRASAWARQLARRLVERLPTDETIELQPVFLVTVPTQGAGEGHLILGSTPGPDLAVQYAASLGATHAVVGTYVESAAGARRIDASLVDVATRSKVEDRGFAIPSGQLHLVENEIGEWIAEATGARGAIGNPPGIKPAVATEPAYAALLEAMDEEVNATLMRSSDPARAAASLQAALARYVVAARLDPDAAAPEERLLIMAAESLERGDAAAELAALEQLIEARPRSWRAHYILGQLRAEARDANGAIVAFEHAHALRPLPDADLVRLAELYANAAAPAPALAHLRRIGPSSAAYGSAQELLAIVSFQRGDLATGREAFARAVSAGATSWELHASYGAALHARGETADAASRYRDALAAGAGAGAPGREAPAAVRLNLARVLVAIGDRDGATAELDTLLANEVAGEVAGHAHRLRFGLREPALERELERAGEAALAGEAASLDASKTVFERALVIDPALWEAHFGLGIVARQRGDAAAAQASFRRVLELWPDQPDGLHELGVALLMGNNAGGALAALDQAAALRPDDPAYVADAGFAHLRAGDLVRARQWLERAARLDANDPITRSYLGELERVEAEAGKQS